MGHPSHLYLRPFNGMEAPAPMSMMFSDPEKYMELMQQPVNGGKRMKRKKLTGKEKRANAKAAKAGLL